MSFADEIMDLWGTEQLMEHFGDTSVLSLLKRNGDCIVANIDAIVDRIRTYEEIGESGIVQKRQGRRIDILKSSLDGISDSFLDARCRLLDGSIWDIEEIETETATMYRFITMRAEDIEFRRKGFYDR